jgi:hypothetical protein
MTTWGYILLAGFVALGLTERLTWRKATRYAVILTAGLFVYEFSIGGLS